MTTIARTPNRISARLRASILKSRRKTLYNMLFKKYKFVPCFVCGRNVDWHESSIEHIVPISKGGTDDMENLSISHRICNLRRGNNDTIHKTKLPTV